MIVRLLAEEKVPNVKFNAAWAAGKMGAARVGDIESIRAALTVRAPPRTAPEPEPDTSSARAPAAPCCVGCCLPES